MNYSVKPSSSKEYLSAQDVVKKFILYAEAKQRLQDRDLDSGESILLLSRTVRDLRRTLKQQGLADELLDLPGESLAQAIYEYITK